jgi:hypothetical protein
VLLSQSSISHEFVSVGLNFNYLLQLGEWSDGAEKQQPAFGFVVWNDEVLEKPTLHPPKTVV